MPTFLERLERPTFLAVQTVEATTEYVDHHIRHKLGS